jgi:hypothetical protein
LQYLNCFLEYLELQIRDDPLGGLQFSEHIKRLPFLDPELLLQLRGLLLQADALLAVFSPRRTLVLFLQAEKSEDRPKLNRKDKLGCCISCAASN